MAKRGISSAAEVFPEDAEAQAPEHRPSFLDTALRDIPFQLLPHVVHPPELVEKTLAWQEEFFNGRNGAPSFAICILGHTDEQKRLAESLAVQSYRNFRVYVANDHNGGLQLANVLRSHSLNVEFTPVAANESMAAAMFKVVDADYVITLDASSLLHPFALFTLAKEVLEVKPEFLFTNEVICSADYSEPLTYLRRSVLDRYSLLSRNTVGTNVLVNSDVAAALANGLEGVGDEPELVGWYLATEAISRRLKTRFLPLGITARNEAKLYQNDEATRILVERYASTIGLELLAFHSLQDQTEPLYRPFAANPSSSIHVVIPFRDNAELTISCLKSLATQSIASDLRISLVDNGSEPTSVRSIERFVATSFFQDNAEIISAPGSFNFAKLNNFGAAQHNSDFVLFLNNDIELCDSTALEELRSWCALPDVGAVGGELSYPEGDIQHAGISFMCWGPANVRSTESYSHVVRETNAVSFAMAMVKREAFNSVGGLDELNCPNGFGDALFGHRLHERGYSVLFTPFAKAIHHESKSRGVSPEELEKWEMFKANLPISDLYGDFQALHQPTRLDLRPREQTDPSAFERLILKIRRKPRLHRIVEFLSSLVLRLTHRAP